MNNIKASKYIFLILIISLFFSANTLYSQSDKQPAQVQEEKVEELKAVPVIEIPQRIENAYVILKEMQAQKIPSTPIDTLKKEFQKLLDENKELKKESTPEYFDALPIRKLEDYDNMWNSHLNELLKYKSTLESSAEDLSESRALIEKAKVVWKLTYDNAKTEKAPKALLTRLLELNKEFKAMDKSLFKTLNNVLLLRDKISVEEISTNEIITTLETAIEENKSLLFTLDAPPIWEAFSIKVDSSVLSENRKSSLENISKSFFEFYDLYSGKLIYYLLFFIMILLFVNYLARFAKENIDNFDENNDRTESLNLLNKPFAVSVLITLFLQDLFFPLAPRIISDIFGILMIFPLLTLFPAFIAKSSRGPLYFISSIYLLQQIVEVSFSDTINQRIIVIVLIVLLIIALIWIMRIPLTRVQETGRKLLEMLKTLSKFMVFILFLTLLANIIGNTSLSRLVLNGIMNAIYVSLLLITGYQIFIVILTIYLKTKFANIFYTVRNDSEKIKKTLMKIAKLAAYIIWFALFLNGFGLYDSLKNSVIDLMNESWNVGETTISVGSIFLFFFSIWISIKISQLIRFFLDGEILPRIKLPRGVAGAISTIMNYVIITLGLFFALIAIGFDLSKFTIIAGALGVGIGFGMQNIVNNFISGLILLFERPIQVGDTIGIQNLVGTVKRIGIRSSIIKGFDGSEEIVPNADLISARVTNWTLSDNLRRIEIKIGVEYGTDPEQVIEILKYSISSRDDVVSNPSSYVLFNGFGESTLNFTFRFWTTNSGDWIFIRSDVLLYINSLLKDAGIKIPFPQMDIHINENTDQKKTDSENNLIV